MLPYSAPVENSTHLVMPQTNEFIYTTCDAVRTTVSGILRKQDWNLSLDLKNNDMRHWHIDPEGIDSGFVPD